MKKLAVIFIVLFHFSAFSQSFWSKVIDDPIHNKSTITDNSLFQDSLILVSGYTHLASCPGSKFFAFDLNGNRIWENDGYFDLINTDNKVIYTAGYTGVDDVIGFDQLVISKYNETGELVFQNGYPEIPHDGSFEFKPTSMDVSEHGSILVSSKKSIIRADSLGKVISETQMRFQSDIAGIQFLSDDSILINTSFNLYKSDSFLNHLDSISFDKNLISALVKRDTIYCLFQHELIVLNTNLDILDTVLTETNIELKAIKSFGLDIWIQGETGNESRILQMRNCTVVKTLIFNLLIQSPDFIVTENEVVFTGVSNSGQIALYSYNKVAEPDQLSLPDIELVDFEISHIGIDYVPIPGQEDYPRGYNFVTEMVIRNNGTDTIKSFAIYSYLHGGMNCAHNYFYQKFSEVLLLPNSEISIQLKRIYEDDLRNNKICFECLAPNSLIEINLDKNYLCKTFEITGLVDLANSKQYRIYPNPTHKFLKLELEEEGVKLIRLTNLKGRVLFEAKISDFETIIDLNNYNQGIYLLSVTTAKKYYIQKILKVE